MDEIREQLLQNRPTLSEGTQRTYMSLYRGICKSISVEPTLEALMNSKEAIMTSVMATPLNSRKTRLSAMYVLTNDTEYHKAMMTDIKEADAEAEKQEMNEKQEENWIEFDEIKRVYSETKTATARLWLERNPTIQELQEIQQFVILSVVSGVHIPPRRLLDWTEFKIANIDKEKDNYYDGVSLVFNTYKTAKTYGSQVIKVPPALKTILVKWIARNPTDYLLFDVNGSKLSTTSLNQRINRFFGDKKIGANMLRHIFVSDVVHKNTPKLKKLKDIANAMGHSVNMSLLYKKERRE